MAENNMTPQIITFAAICAAICVTSLPTDWQMDIATELEIFRQLSGLYENPLR